MERWKWVGLAGAVGVVATGAVVARQERKRRSYTADDVRARLHERAGVHADEAGQAGSASRTAS